MHLTQIQDGQGTLSVDFCVFLVCVNFHKGLQYFYYILFKKKKTMWVNYCTWKATINFNFVLTPHFSKMQFIQTRDGKNEKFSCPTTEPHKPVETG